MSVLPERLTRRRTADAARGGAATGRVYLTPVFLPLWVRKGAPTKLRYRVAVFAFALAVWEVAGRLGYTRDMWVSYPSAIAGALVTMTLSGELIENLIVSMQRVAMGLLVGTGIGLTLGLALGWSKRLEDVFMPFLTALYPLPKLAILPLLVFWFGIGEGSKIALIAFGTFFYVCLNTFTGTRIVDPVLVKVAASYRATNLQLLRFVLLPNALPLIMTGVKLAAGYALALVVAAEMIAAQSGLGRMVLLAGQFLQIEKLMAGVLMFGVLGVAVYALVDWLERRLAPWRT